jgi:hypothetical protein
MCNCISLDIKELEVLLDSLKKCPECKESRRVPGYAPAEQNRLYEKLHVKYHSMIDAKVQELDVDKTYQESSCCMEYGIGVI